MSSAHSARRAGTESAIDDRARERRQRRAASRGGPAASPARANPTGDDRLQAARSGDADAFGCLVAAHRRALLRRCRRMLRSLPDAEDALQDTLLRAWRGLPGFDGRSALGTWLDRIATNACLDAIARRPTRLLRLEDCPPEGAGQAALPADGPWSEPGPDQVPGLADGHAAPEARYEQREAVELALLTAVQQLPPRQRAVLVLRDVLGFSAKEVSQSLGTTVAAVNGALHRARKALDQRVPDERQQALVRAPAGAGAHEMVERLVDAFERGDVEAVVALLAEDAGGAMPAAPRRSAVTPAIPAPRTVSARASGCRVDSRGSCHGAGAMTAAVVNLTRARDGGP
jgi:RNA polymerase sigma-70 factor (ECF subfamily)